VEQPPGVRRDDNRGKGLTMPAPLTTAPIELYRDPEVYERERTAIFGRTWQFLGLEADMIRAGDYLAETLAGFPIVVVRDGGGALLGYHNLCRHRAGPLVGEAKGRCDREFVCRFHAWRYGFDGRLIEPTGFGADAALSPADYSLYPVRVETWRGFIFVNLDGSAAPLAEQLQPLDERLGHQPRRPAKLRDHHPVACNWKVFVENYLDGYHKEGVHPSLSGKPGSQRLPVRIVGKTALYEPQGASGPATSLWAWIWPNTGISVYRGVLMLEHMRPVGPDRTQLEHVFLHEPEDPRVEAAIVNAERITEEDAWLSERVQANLDAGMYRQGVLSPTDEGAVAWFQSEVARALKE
jgi:choline monooxygenase